MYDVPRGIIVSIQDTFSEGSFAHSAWVGGAVALRVRVEHAGVVRRIIILVGVWSLPIIALTKDLQLPTEKGGVVERLITANKDRVDYCRTFDPDYIATGAVVYGTDVGDVSEDMIADVATVEQAIAAEELGYGAVTTALAGYTDDYRCKEGEGPDINLVENIADKLTIPVIAEGRYFTTDQVRVAFDAGAHSVCIGGAITRPDLITKRFVKAVT